MKCARGVSGRMWTAAWLLGAALLLTAGVSFGGGQSGSQTPAPGGASAPNGGSNSAMPAFDDTDPLARARQATQSRTYANERQKKLLADADKLVELSNELRAEVGSSTKNDLSLTVIKKAGEIEKLAHDVRERERN